MTSSELINQVYANFDTFLDLWNEKNDDSAGVGVFVFNEKNYSNVRTIEEAKFIYCSLDVARQLFIKDELALKTVHQYLTSLDYGSEFLFIVLEYQHHGKDLQIYFHKASRVGLS